MKPPLELTGGKKVSKRQARLINKARQALDPLNKTEKQPLRAKVPTRTSIDAMAAPRRIRGGGKVLVDSGKVSTRIITDEELMAEVARRRLGVRASMEPPQANKKKHTMFVI